MFSRGKEEEEEEGGGAWGFLFCAPSTRIYLLAVFENALFIALNSAFCPLNKTMKFLK